MRFKPGARCIGALAAAWVAFGGHAEAQDNAAKVPPPTVIVLDVQAAMQNSVAAKVVRTQRDQFLAGYQTEQETARKVLKQTETELVKQKATQPQEAWQAKARAFEQQVYEFNQRYQKTNQAVEKSFRVAMAELSQALAQVTDEVATELGANLVLPKSQIFLHDPRMEVTQTVIDRLNRKHPTVVFPAPVIEGASAPQATAPAAGKKK
ncbi:OmpH family outer membrane protein [Magnetospirillum sp. UT-4]|uniref:OmpH family outer membrane protein n=1 Tax=Magnetospirillum sp. UT-4 TaxID=2681467 RepID=UPI00137C4886|nr:OmpH family outer membrane protein [Magnetospirillum sp. UT-4]CAA7616028.1 Outer membrane protein [Magnetospirillum sp. UT-4]